LRQGPGLEQRVSRAAFWRTRECGGKLTWPDNNIGLILSFASYVLRATCDVRCGQLAMGDGATGEVTAVDFDELKILAEGAARDAAQSQAKSHPNPRPCWSRLKPAFSPSDSFVHRPPDLSCRGVEILARHGTEFLAVRWGADASAGWSDELEDIGGGHST
jgi:hypothetical protein